MSLALLSLLGKVVGARDTVAALRTVQVIIGVLLLAAALSLIGLTAPSGIFLRLPARAQAPVYKCVLGVVAVFGSVQFSLAFWLVPRDMEDRRATVDEVMLWVSLFFIALMASLRGFSFLEARGLRCETGDAPAATVVQQAVPAAEGAAQDVAGVQREPGGWVPAADLKSGG